MLINCIALALLKSCENFTLWWYSFNYFESALAFPFIFDGREVPKCLNACLTIGFWLFTLIGVVAPIVSWTAFYMYWVEVTNKVDPLNHGLLEWYYWSSIFSFGTVIVTTLVLIAAIILIHYLVSKRGFKTLLKTKAFVLNLVLILIYITAWIIFYIRFNAIHNQLEGGDANNLLTQLDYLSLIK